MSEAQHRRAVGLALRAGDDLATLFNKLGTAEHPRGLVLTAYRNARRSIAGAAKGGKLSPVAVVEIFAGLRLAIQDAITTTLTAAAEAGLTQADKTLALYGLRPSLVNPISQAEAVTAILSTVVSQESAALWQVMNDVTAVEVLLGDATRVGIISPAPTNKAATNWLASMMAASFQGGIGGALTGGGKEEFRKQAIAGIDHRTTDCCLRAHAQVQPMDGTFRLTGTPRYADRLPWVPFHWY